MRHSLGRIVATAAVAATVPQAVITGLLDRDAASPLPEDRLLPSHLPPATTKRPG
jgi:hypothetical protein